MVLRRGVIEVYDADPYEPCTSPPPVHFLHIEGGEYEVDRMSRDMGICGLAFTSGIMWRPWRRQIGI